MTLRRTWSALALLVAAGAWPSVYGAFTLALASPYERALRSALCGAPLHDMTAFAGHCAACWAGAALLAGLGAMLLLPSPQGEGVMRKHDGWGGSAIA